MSATSSLSPLRVLVVDDCPDTTESLAWLLGHWGCDARIAHDGPAALDTACAFRPHVVLLDLGLPGMDGCEVARRLRVLPGLEPISLICITGYATEEYRSRSLKAGFDHFLAKPAHPEDLRRLLVVVELSFSGREPSALTAEGTVLAVNQPAPALGPPESGRARTRPTVTGELAGSRSRVEPQFAPGMVGTADGRPQRDVLFGGVFVGCR